MTGFNKQTNDQATAKVLVLGDDIRSFLTVIRSLGRRGLSVHIGWHPPDSPALSSRYVSKVHFIPPFSLDDDAWKNKLISIMQNERFDLVIPCNDQSLIPIQKHRKELERHGSIYLLDDRVFDVVNDKRKTAQLAQSLDISFPGEVLVSGIGQVDQVLESFNFPLILKPVSSFGIENLVSKRFVRKVHNREQLIYTLTTMLTEGTVLVQACFDGVGVGIELLADHGKMLVTFEHLRVHEPHTGGGSSYRKSVPLDQRLLKAASDLMARLEYTGVAMVEFRVDFRTGRWVLLEINGRFWGSLPLAVAAGADFPHYLYQLLVEGKRVFPADYKTGLYCRNFLKDLKWMIQNLRGSISNPLGLLRTSLDILKGLINIVTFRERSDTFVLDDMRPAFKEIALAAAKLCSVLNGKIRLSMMSLPGMRGLYLRKTHRALRNAKNVLFVCRGNICRSPFAEHYARKLLPRTTRITSTGFYPISNRASPPEAIEAAEKLGINLSPHRSSIINQKMVHQADAIFIFDDKNLREMLEHYPLSINKIYWLGHLAKKGPLAIPDPYGRGRAAFEQTYRRIAELLSSVNLD